MNHGFRFCSVFAFVFTIAIFGCLPVLAADCSEHTCARCAKAICKLSVSTQTEESGCFAVECKQVCIPPVTFPWQCAPSKCGQVRTVKVLKAEKRERQICKYQWDVLPLCWQCCEAGSAASPTVSSTASPTVSPAEAASKEDFAPPRRTALLRLPRLGR